MQLNHPKNWFAKNANLEGESEIGAGITLCTSKNRSSGKIVAFTSDTHFGHANVIKYCNRPFCKPEDFTDDGKWISKGRAVQRAAEMDEHVINGWNSVVTNDNDIIIHLGDFSFGDIEPYLSRLNGIIWMICGNHDKQMRQYLESYRGKKIREMSSLTEFKINDKDFSACHYAMRVWNKSHYGAYHIYGHSHGGLLQLDNRSMDVGIDSAKKLLGEYRPFTVKEVIDLLEPKAFGVHHIPV